MNLLLRRGIFIAILVFSAGCASYSAERFSGQETGIEIKNDRLLTRKLDAALLKNKISEQKSYLLNAAHPQYFGYYKKYDVLTDTAETRLRTVYSASAAYSLLKIKEEGEDATLDKTISSIVDFLLFMQVKEGPLKGAFHYSFDPLNQAKEQRYVVGTASKAIFTLIQLYENTHDPDILRSAEDAGAWLIQQIDASGKVFSEIRFSRNEWKVSEKKSYLYSGQVLSALSRLYAVAKRPEIYEAAAKVAASLLRSVERENYFVGDDFREPNTVSTSWVVMSFIDFSKINQGSDVYEEAAFRSMDEILKHQITNSSDLLRYGRFDDTDASSGNGWINEVLVEAYQFCTDRQQEDCKRYLDASILITRWLVQNVYSVENTSQLPNPIRARGGLIRNSKEKSVRTDAVCHSLNGMVELLSINPNIYFEIPK